MNGMGWVITFGEEWCGEKFFTTSGVDINFEVGLMRRVYN